MPEKNARKSRQDPAARQMRVYRIVIIVLSAIVALSMILQMIAK